MFKARITTKVIEKKNALLLRNNCDRGLERRKAQEVKALAVHPEDLFNPYLGEKERQRTDSPVFPVIHIPIMALLPPALMHRLVCVHIGNKNKCRTL